MDLEMLRKKVDETDEQMLKALAKRMRLVLQIAEYKKEKGLPLRHGEREEQLLEQRKQLAKKLGLDEDFAERLCKAIIKESLRVEQKT